MTADSSMVAKILSVPAQGAQVSISMPNSESANGEPS